MHRVVRWNRLPRPPLEPVPCRERRPDRAAGVAGRRLNPDRLVRAFAKNAAVADAVQGDAARETQVVRAGLRMKGRRQPQHHFFGDVLDRPGQIHLPLRQLRLGLPRRAAEDSVESTIRHRQPGGIVEELHVHPERPVRFEIEELVVNRLDVLGLTVGREPHDLVLTRIDLEAGVVGERGIEQTDRVRKRNLPERGEILAFTEPGRCRGPLADAVHAQHGRGVER